MAALQLKELILSKFKNAIIEILMHVTGGYHYHTVRAENDAVLDRIEAVLNERKYIVPEI